MSKRNIPISAAQALEFGMSMTDDERSRVVITDIPGARGAVKMALGVLNDVTRAVATLREFIVSAEPTLGCPALVEVQMNDNGGCMLDYASACYVWSHRDARGDEQELRVYVYCDGGQVMSADTVAWGKTSPVRRTGEVRRWSGDESVMKLVPWIQALLVEVGATGRSEWFG